MGWDDSQLVCGLPENGGTMNDPIPYRDPSDRASLLRSLLWLMLAVVLGALAVVLE